MKFVDTTIENVCDVGSSKRIYKSDYQSSGVPFYRAKEISEKHRGAEVSDHLFISREKFEAVKSKFGAPVDGDLLLTSIGALLGDPYVVNCDGDFYFKDGNLTWFRNFDGLDSRYLYYWLVSPDGKAQLNRATIGSAQPAFTIAALRQMEISLPDLHMQRKIASILSAYDDLIENNLRRIKILEEMAQNSYREWFVKFRFPGYEDERMVDSDLAKVPKGWETLRLDELVEFRNEGTNAGEHLRDRVYLPIDCLPRKGLAINEVKSWTEAKSSLHLFEQGDIIFGAMRPYFHKVVVAPFAGVTRKTCFVLRRKQHEFAAFCAMTVFQESTINFAHAHSKGSTIPYAVWAGAMDGMQVVTPPKEVASRFQEVVGPMIEFIGETYSRNQVLSETRDLLLPRLISGELDVSELDIETPEEAA